MTKYVCSHFSPNPIFIAERFHFYRHDQQIGESVTVYMLSFAVLALRGRLICGLRNKSNQQSLLGEADLTLAKTMDIAQGRESDECNAKSLKNQGLVLLKAVPPLKELKHGHHVILRPTK